MADAKAEQQAGGIGLALCLDRGEEVVDRLFLPALAAEQFLAVRGQAEDIGGLLDPAEIEEFDEGLLAKSLDIERAAADEMLEPFEPLGGTDQPAGAADIDFAFLRHCVRLAFGAVGGEDPRVAGFV